MKIGVKLALGFAAALVSLLAVIIFSISGLSGLNDEVHLIANDRVPKTIWANGIIDLVNDGARGLRNAMLTQDPAVKKEQIERTLATNQKMQPFYDSLTATIKSKEGLALMQKVLDARVKFVEERKVLIDLIEAGRNEEATVLLFGSFREIQTQYIAGINEIIAYQTKLTEEAGKEAEEAYANNRNLIIGISIAAFVIVIFFALYITRSITKPLSQAVEAAEKISDGNINVNLESDSKDETGILIMAMKKMAGSIKSLIDDTKVLTEAAAAGKLDVRAEASKHKGAYKDIVAGVNNTLDSVIGPLNVAAEYVDRISKGDIPPKITDSYNGDFNEIKNNLNQCIDVMTGLLLETNSLIQATKDGKLDKRGNPEKFVGGWSELVGGVNQLIDAFVGPINVTAEYVDRISKGDIPPKITDNYNGDFNEIKNNLNQAIDAVNALVLDSNSLAQGALDGKLDVRADAIKHLGDFRRIIQGVNGTLDAIVEPMNEAANVLSIMATGDLTSSVTGDYKGDYQILKNNINSLLDSLSNLIKQISGAVEHVAEASLEISGTADAMAAASQEQSSQADEVASAVEMMSRTITENAMAASRTAVEAENNGKVAKEGGEVVAQTVNKMKDIATVVKQSADNIEKLGESSKQIGEIISVIDDIADQTNLLALNAAIEAARAGEQGRGFAVVADEVRKLAERTTEATKQIASMIKGIQSETQEAVNAMKKGNDEVNSGIALADKAGQALNQILESTQEVQMMISKIAVASEEQSSTSEEIAKNVNSISHVTNDATKRIQEIAKSSEEMAKLTDNLKDLVSQFKIEDELSSYKNARGSHLQGKFKNKHLPARGM